MTMSPRHLALLLAAFTSLGAACDREAPPTSAPSEPTPEVSEPSQAAEAPTPGPDAGPEASAPDPDDDEPSLQREINAHYHEQTDPKKWQSRFEREGREVYDRRDEVIAALSIAPGSEVADVGAGSGLFTMELARAAGRDGTVYAVDVQDYFLEHIEERASKQGLKNVKPVQATQRSAQLPPDSVDLVVMVDAYHHVEHPRPYLQSLHQALREDGRLVVIDYARIEGQSEAWLLDHIRADPETFRREIEAAGFELVKRHDLLEENFFFEFRRTASPG